MGLFGGGSKKDAKSLQSYTEYEQALGGMSVTAAQAQRQAAEQTRMQVGLSLGQPGTYELPYEQFYANQLKTNPVTGAAAPFSGPAALSTGIFDTSNIYDPSATDFIKLQNILPRNYAPLPKTSEDLDAALKRVGVSTGVSQFDPAAVQKFLQNPTATAFAQGKYEGKQGLGQGIASADLPQSLDPTKYLGQLSLSRDYRTVSYLTAQADQLVRGQGELWQSMTQSVLGPIYQGAASLQRESAADIARMVARGGSARMQGLGEALRFQEQEKINTSRTNQLWSANLSLKQWAIDNSRRQLLFNQAWTSNQAGIRDEYSNAIQSLSQFFSGTVVPSTINNAQRNFEIMQSYNKDYTGLIIGGALLVVGLAAGGTGAAIGATALGDALSSIGGTLATAGISTGVTGLTGQPTSMGSGISFAGPKPTPGGGGNYPAGLIGQSFNYDPNQLHLGLLGGGSPLQGGGYMTPSIGDYTGLSLGLSPTMQQDYNYVSNLNPFGPRP